MVNTKLLQGAGGYLVSHAPIVFLFVSADGRILQVNTYTRGLFGEQLIASGIADIFLDFGGPVDIADLRRSPDTPQLLSVATDSGLPESFLFHFVPMGEDTLIFGGTDADEARRLRQELLVLNNQLGGLTRELQKKNQQLAELNTLKNQFLGMAAHDLRAPVGAILAFSEFLLDETGASLSEEHLKFLRIIHSSTDFMRRMIDAFLDISLIEAGRFPLNLAEVDIVRPVERSLARQEIMARKRRITLRLVNEIGSGVLWMDEDKIEQVIINLVANAIDHAPEDSEVTVWIAKAAAGLTVAVVDTGPGLAEEEMARIFGPYERGRARKAAGSRSTGLGLAISKKIIDAHGGRIWVESRLGHGARFSFMVPGKVMVVEEGGGGQSKE